MTQQEYENKIKELQDELEQLKAAKIAGSEKRYKPVDKQIYWVVYDGADKVAEVNWVNSDFDNWNYLTGNCFKTEEEAEEYKKQIEYTARYKNYIEEHSEPLDWNDGSQMKYGAWFGFASKKVNIEQTAQGKQQGAIYASSKEIIEDAIEEIGEDNFKKYVLGVK